MPKFLAKNANKSIVINMFGNFVGHFEEDFYWEYVNFYNGIWLEVIDNRRLIEHSIAGHFQAIIAREPCLILPGNMVRSLKKYFGDKVRTLSKESEYASYIVVDPNEKQKNLIILDLVVLLEC